MRGADRYYDARLWTLYNAVVAAAGATASQTAQYFDAQGYDGVGVARLAIHFDANAAAADNAVVLVEKCTDTSGSNNTTVATFTTQAGTGVERWAVENKQINLYDLGDTSGTPYRYLRASVTITDANASGTYGINVSLVAARAKEQPVAVT